MEGREGVPLIDHGEDAGALRYFTAAELPETAYRGQADSSVGRVIDSTRSARGWGTGVPQPDRGPRILRPQEGRRQDLEPRVRLVHDLREAWF
jgi:hypothetical protein